MDKNQKFLLGALSALLAGVAVGLLVAPKNGKETRELIKNKAGDLGGTAKDKYEKSLEELTALADRLKEGFNNNVNSVKEKAGSLATTVSDKVHGVVNNNV